MTAWNLRPIASALWRNRTGAILVAFQIAIGLAVLVNAVYVVKQRVEKIGRPTGMDTANMICGGERRLREGLRLRGELARGPRDAARPARASRPRASSATSRCRAAAARAASRRGPARSLPRKRSPGNNYDVDEHGDRGARRQADRGTAVRGARDPAAVGNASRSSPQAIVTQAFAKELFPKDPNPLGKTFYDGLSKPITIVGIIEHMQAPGSAGTSSTTSCCSRASRAGRRRSTSSAPSRASATRVMRDDRGEARRLEPGRAAALGAAVRLLHRPVLPGRPQHGDLPRERHERAARDHRARHLRPRDVQREHAHPPDRHAPRGRRAAARHRAVLPGRELDGHDRGRRRRAAAPRSAVGYWISVKYELPRLDLYYLVGGVLAIWLIGLLAAWQPARRASAISPAVATRTV